MTQEELRHIDERFENLKEFFIEKINNIAKILNNYINISDCRHKDQQADISILYTKANENEKNIIRIEGDIKEMKGVKVAENGIKEKGIKMWQFVLGLSIPIIFSSVVSLIVYILSNKP